MDNEDEIDFYNFSTWNLNTITKFINENFIQILLFILVFVIIYVVDYIANLNALIYAVPSAIPGVQQTYQNSTKEIKPKRKRQFKK